MFWQHAKAASAHQLSSICIAKAVHAHAKIVSSAANGGMLLGTIFSCVQAPSQSDGGLSMQPPSLPSRLRIRLPSRSH
jgi:hypothetical protein